MTMQTTATGDPAVELQQAILTGPQSVALTQLVEQRDQARRAAMDFEAELHDATTALQWFWKAQCCAPDNPARESFFAAAVEAYATYVLNHPDALAGGGV